MVGEGDGGVSSEAENAVLRGLQSSVVHTGSICLAAESVILLIIGLWKAQRTGRGVLGSLTESRKHHHRRSGSPIMKDSFVGLYAAFMA